MTIKQIYSLAISEGIKNDLRGVKRVKEILKRINDKYDKLSEEQKADFDEERLINPYSDTRVFHGDLAKKIKKAMVGVDIDTGEVMLANELNRQHPDNPVDLIIGHHPLSGGLAGLHEVMELQTEIYANYGVPINIADKLMRKRIGEIERAVSGSNHGQSVDAARILDIPIMSIHTPADNHVASHLAKEIKKREKDLMYVEDVMKFLKTIPEYQEAAKQKAGPMIFCGSSDSFAGKIAVTEITGGTDGAKELYERLAHAGVGTVLSMHLKEEWKEEAQKHHLNVIMVGHMSSDSLGLNLLLDNLEKKGIEIVPCSGFTRISRVKRNARKK
ncbi:Nif3-like dinuclear metal center hexameric protein [Patescibacteria group bacterium]|nr:Nif3-like dinuclear metal center hexameric protein [Patescibacteria group bacterium]